MANIVIERVTRAPGMVDSEALVLRNRTNAVIDISGWVLRSAAPNSTPFQLPANTSLDPDGTLEVISGENPAGRNLPDPPGKHYLKQPSMMTVWDGPSVIAVLTDAGGIEQSRYGGCPLPPNAAHSRIVVPAFFDFGALDQWQFLSAASNRADMVVLARPDWPELASGDAVFADDARQRLSVEGVVLGVVDARVGGTLLTGPQLNTRIEAWYQQFGTRVNGIFLRDLILADQPGDNTEALALLRAFKQGRPGHKAMITANGCTDSAVMSVADWVILWEGDATTYTGTFQARNSGAAAAVPGWWRNPVYRTKIVHLVHSCPEPWRQQVIGYANERNAGNFYVTDSTGYDRLPPLNPYWDRELIEASSYLDFGLDPRRALEAASRWGSAQRSGPVAYLHGWPTGEQVWNWQRIHVRGTFLLKPDPTVSSEVVRLSELRPGPDSAELGYDVAAAWAAAHQWAVRNNFKTALPTFRMSTLGGDPAMRLFTISPDAPWLETSTIPRTQTYQQPSYNEALTLLRNLGRVPPAGFWSAIPTFGQTGPLADIPDSFTVLAFTANNHPVSPSPIDFQDAPTVDYIHTL